MSASRPPSAAQVDWTGVLLAFVCSRCSSHCRCVVVATWAFTEVWRYPSVIPQQFGLRFWSQTLARTDVWDALFLSLRLATTVTVLSAIICLPAAYAFARMRFPGRNILFLSFLASHAFPKFGLLVAIAGIFLQMGLISTFWGVVLIQLVGTLMLMIWIPVAAFQNVDRRMEEARARCRQPLARLLVDHLAAGRRRRSQRPCLLTFVGTFYETEGRLADRCARDPHHAGADDHLHQQPDRRSIWRGALGDAVGALLIALMFARARRRHRRLRKGALAHESIAADPPERAQEWHI